MPCLACKILIRCCASRAKPVQMSAPGIALPDAQMLHALIREHIEHTKGTTVVHRRHRKRGRVRPAAALRRRIPRLRRSTIIREPVASLLARAILVLSLALLLS